MFAVSKIRELTFECVELYNEIIAGPPRCPSKTAAAKELPTERLLERLQPIENTIKGRGNQLQQDILRSREELGAEGAALECRANRGVGAVQLSAH